MGGNAGNPNSAGDSLSVERLELCERTGVEVELAAN